jgi:hypothetical protein
MYALFCPTHGINNRNQTMYWYVFRVVAELT